MAHVDAVGYWLVWSKIITADFISQRRDAIGTSEKAKMVGRETSYSGSC